MVGGSMNGKTNNPPGGYSMEVAVVRPPFCFACAYSRNVWQAPRTGDALPGGKVDADICQQPLADAPGGSGTVPGFPRRLRCVPTLEVGFTKCPLSLVHGLAACSPPSAPPGGLVVSFMPYPSIPDLPCGRSVYSLHSGRLFLFGCAKMA